VDENNKKRNIMKKKKEQGDNQATIAIDASSMEKPPINPIK